MKRSADEQPVRERPSDENRVKYAHQNAYARAMLDADRRCRMTNDLLHSAGVQLEAPPDLTYAVRRSWISDSVHSELDV